MSVTFMAQWGKGADGINTVIGDESVNMHGGNAATVLGLLGFGQLDEWGELYGEAGPAAFLGRVLVARAMLDTATDDARGVPAVADGGPGTGRALWITGARSAGRLAELLGELEDLAHEAARHEDGEVVWA